MKTKPTTKQRMGMLAMRLENDAQLAASLSEEVSDPLTIVQLTQLAGSLEGQATTIRQRRDELPFPNA